MKVALACDHAGYELKQFISNILLNLGFQIEDFGCHSNESCDYADYGLPAAKAVASGECEYGVLICMTGIGMSIVANKIKGIRCAHCSDVYQAELTRRHNNANMLAIGSGFTGHTEA